MMGGYVRFIERRIVRVAPEHELLEQEKGEEPHEHRGHDAVNAAVLKRLRQQVEKHRSEQCADREAHQPADPPCARGKRSCREQQSQRTASKASEDDRSECRHGEAGAVANYR